jgi:hypothetical protein
MKKLVFIICLFLFTSILSPISSEGNSKVKSDKELFRDQITYKTDHTFLRQFEFGVWWIYEYDEDGKLVNEYPAE